MEGHVIVRRWLAWGCLVVLVLTLAACNPLDDDEEREGDLLYQVSTINALEQGWLDGQVEFEDLAEHGDFGVGTFEALDGEMVAFDGTFYQVRADGVVSEVDDEMETPFAAVVFFESDLRQSIDETLSCEDLQTRIDQILPSADTAYAIAVEGSFEAVTTRSVPAQSRPYPSLSEAVTHQVEFELGPVEGTLVGFRLPEYMQGANAVGYHFHFLTDDRQTGGHVLSCQTAVVELLADDIEEWRVQLPEQDD